MTAGMEVRRGLVCENGVGMDSSEVIEYGG